MCHGQLIDCHAKENPARDPASHLMAVLEWRLYRAAPSRVRDWPVGEEGLHDKQV
jgi:hypothetical protein